MRESHSAEKQFVPINSKKILAISKRYTKSKSNLQDDKHAPVISMKLTLNIYTRRPRESDLTNEPRREANAKDKSMRYSKRAGGCFTLNIWPHTPTRHLIIASAGF